MDSVYTKRVIITMVLFAVNIAKLAVLFYNLSEAEKENFKYERGISIEKRIVHRL